jgi:RHH-type rel operon transcriptional repressor/antitoxin RelB
MSAVLSLRIDDKIYNQLDTLSKKSGINKTKFLKQALLEYMEDREDYFLAVEALEDIKSGRDKIVSWDEVKKELGL